MKTGTLKSTLIALAFAAGSAQADNCPPCAEAPAKAPDSAASAAAEPVFYYNPWADMLRMQAMQNALINSMNPLWRPVMWGPPMMPPAMRMMDAPIAMPMSMPVSHLQPTAEGYRLELPLPAFKADDIHVRLDGRLLTITAETANTVKVGGGDEQSRRSFAETLTLPAEVQPSALKQQFENGVLTITLPAAKASGGPA